MGIFSIFKRKEDTKEQQKDTKEQQKDIRNKENLKGLSIDSKRVIAGLVNNPCSVHQTNAMQVKAQLKNVLNNKLARLSYNQDEYAENLKRNILFFINTIEDKENLIKAWINSGNMPQIEKCISIINSIPDKYKGTKVYCKNAEKLKVYDKYFPITMQIEQLEYDYMFYSIHSEIIHMLLGVILSNEEEFLKLRDCNADLVIEDIDGYCTHTASYCLGTLSSKLNI